MDSAACLSDTLFLLFLKSYRKMFLIISCCLLPVYCFVIWISLTEVVSMASTTWQEWLCLGSMISFHRKVNHPSNGVINIYFLRCYYLTQVAIIIGSFIIQVQVHRFVQRERVRYVEFYSLQVEGLPSKPIHRLIPDLLQHIRLIRFKHFGQFSNSITILDIEGSFSEREFYTQVSLRNLNTLKCRIEVCSTDHQSARNFESQKREIELKIAQAQIIEANKHKSVYHYAIWITFDSIADRKVVSRTLKMFNRMGGAKMKVRRAPCPRNIIWQNIYHPKWQTRVTIVLGSLVSLGVIVIFDCLIIQISHSKQLAVWLLPILTSVLESVLQEIVLFTTRCENHKLKSTFQTSTLVKISIKLYLNTAVLVLAKCIDRGSLSQIFAPAGRRFNFDEDWYKGVLSYVVVAFVFNCTVSIFRNFFVRFNELLLQVVVHKVKSLWNRASGGHQQDYGSSEINLGLNYAYALELMMVGISYSYYQPLLTPLLALFLHFMAKSFHKFLLTVGKSSPFNTKVLNKWAARLIYLSSIFGMLLVSYTQSCLETLCCAAVMACLCFLRWLVADEIIKCVKNQNSCFGFASKRNSVPITKLLTEKQRLDKMTDLGSRINSLKCNQSEINRLGVTSDQEYNDLIRELQQCQAHFKAVTSCQNSQSWMIDLSSYKPIIENSKCLFQEVY